MRLCNTDVSSDTLADSTAADNSNDLSPSCESDLTYGLSGKCAIKIEHGEPISKSIANTGDYSNRDNMIQSPQIYDQRQGHIHAPDANISDSVSNTMNWSAEKTKESSEEVKKGHIEIKSVNTAKQDSMTHITHENGCVSTCKRNNVTTNGIENRSVDDKRRCKMEVPKNNPASENHSPVVPRSSLAVERRCSQSKKLMKLRNLADESRVTLDTLHGKAIDVSSHISRMFPCILSSDRALGYFGFETLWGLKSCFGFPFLLSL